MVRSARCALTYTGEMKVSGGIELEAPTKGTPEYIEWTKSQIVGASDSNHDVAPSVTAYVFMLAGAAVCWMCRLQKVSSISSSESEFYSLSSCVAMSIHMRNMLTELGEKDVGQVDILCDSRGARMLAVHNRSTSRTRHIHRRWFFVTHYSHSGKVKITAVASDDNWSNMLTKPLAKLEFLRDRARLGMICSLV